MREDGFYWVKLGPGWKTQGAWVVAEWFPNKTFGLKRGWQVMDELYHYEDTEFDYICEDRLVPPEIDE